MSTEPTTPLYALEILRPDQNPELLVASYFWWPQDDTISVNCSLFGPTNDTLVQAKWRHEGLARNLGLEMLKGMVRECEGFCSPF